MAQWSWFLFYPAWILHWPQCRTVQRADRRQRTKKDAQDRGASGQLCSKFGVGYGRTIPESPALYPALHVMLKRGDQRPVIALDWRKTRSETRKRAL